MVLHRALLERRRCPIPRAGANIVDSSLSCPVTEDPPFVEVWRSNGRAAKMKGHRILFLTACQPTLVELCDSGRALNRYRAFALVGLWALTFGVAQAGFEPNAADEWLVLPGSHSYFAVDRMTFTSEATIGTVGVATSRVQAKITLTGPGYVYYWYEYAAMAQHDRPWHLGPFDARENESNGAFSVALGVIGPWGRMTSQSVAMVHRTSPNPRSETATFISEPITIADGSWECGGGAAAHARVCSEIPWLPAGGMAKMKVTGGGYFSLGILADPNVAIWPLHRPRPYDQFACWPSPYEWKAVQDQDRNGDRDVLLDEIADQRGDKVQLWGLNYEGREAYPKFAVRYVPIAGTARWIGACNYDAGSNSLLTRGTDTDHDGKKDRFTEVLWANWVDRGSVGTDGDFYAFDTFSEVLTRTPVGHSTFPAQTWDPAPSAYGPLDPPTPNPEMVFYNAFQIELSSHQGDDWTYGAKSEAPGGTVVDVGDTWTIAGRDVSGAYVEGDALRGDFGAWQVAEWNSDYVVFEATSRGCLTEEAVKGFHLVSAEPVGEVAWCSIGHDIDYAGSVLGPVPEPTTLSLLALGGLALLCRRRR